MYLYLLSASDDSSHETETEEDDSMFLEAVTSQVNVNMNINKINFDIRWAPPHNLLCWTWIGRDARPWQDAGSECYEYGTPGTLGNSENSWQFWEFFAVLDIIDNFRRQLPVPKTETEGVNLWNLLCKNIGKDLSKISMPVTLNEPLSTLQVRVQLHPIIIQSNPLYRGCVKSLSTATWLIRLSWLQPLWRGSCNFIHNIFKIFKISSNYLSNIQNTLKYPKKNQTYCEEIVFPSGGSQLSPSQHTGQAMLGRATSLSTLFLERPLSALGRTRASVISRSRFLASGPGSVINF